MSSFKIISRLIFYLKVLVTKPSGKTVIDIATDFEDPLTLHWALSENPGEWLVISMTSIL